jgi:antitoxin VapB
MNTERQVRLCRNGRNQALRIPRDMELPGRAATLRKEGEEEFPAVSRAPAEPVEF